MINLSLDEAQLFRMLSDLFGREQVLPHMSVLSVCGGELPRLSTQQEDKTEWAKKAKCLFTVVDREDNPKLVVEFFSGFKKSIDIKEEEHNRLLPPLLKGAGVQYITISKEEFVEILNPRSEIDLACLLNAKVEDSSSHP